MATEALGARPMLRTVLLKTIRDQRRALLWWSVGLLATALMYAAVYPSIRENAETLNEYLESFPEVFREAFMGESGDFASPAGYLNTELFGFFGPLLLLLYSVGAGARAIAGEEERQTLDMLLSTPVSRARVITDKFVALILGLVTLSVVLWGSVVVLGPPFDLTPDLANLGAATLSCFLLALAFGAIALAIGALTGRRALAIGLSAGLAAATYLFHVLAPSVDAIASLEYLSPFYYYRDAQPLLNGLNVAHALVLLSITVVAFVGAQVAFERRDLAA
ncbi:MAG TPA: ABC transporter permease subunit [Actinomycetota bacterium]